MSRGRRILVVCTPALMAACGGAVGPMDVVADAGAAADDAAATTDLGAPTDADSVIACEPVVADLAASFASAACTTVVRVAYVDHAILGWRPFCGALARTSSDGAKAAFVTVAGAVEPPLPSYAPAPSIYALQGPDPTPDDWVFVATPMDFGGESIVSAATGLTVFWGTTVLLGRGAIESPTTWTPPPPSTGPCAHSAPPTMRLVQGTMDGAGVALTEMDLQAAVSAVWNTAIPAAIGRVQSVTSGLVVAYPRALDAFDPTSAETLVVIDSIATE